MRRANETESVNVYCKTNTIEMTEVKKASDSIDVDVCISSAVGTPL